MSKFKRETYTVDGVETVVHSAGNGEPVAPTKQLHGTLENVNVSNVPGVGHLTIEKSEIMQRRVISDIDAVAFGSRPREVSAAPILAR